jgi:Leucine-rich repeat (LRR) protein
MKKIILICCIFHLAKVSFCQEYFPENAKYFHHLSEMLETPDSVRIVDFNNRGKIEMDEFIKNIEKFKNLEVIQIRDSEIDSIPYSFCTLKKLIYIDISICKISKGLENLALINELVILDLSSNQISYIPENISKLKKLVFLDLSENCIKKIPNSFKKFESLKRLDLYSNKITNHFTFPPKLSWLDMSWCGLKDISWILSQKKLQLNLTYLNLAENQIIDMPKSMDKFTSLFALFLNNNKIQTINCNFIPLNKLSWLDFSNNQLNKQTIEEIKKNKKGVKNLFLK